MNIRFLTDTFQSFKPLNYLTTPVIVGVAITALLGLSVWKAVSYLKKHYFTPIRGGMEGEIFLKTITPLESQASNPQYLPNPQEIIKSDKNENQPTKPSDKTEVVNPETSDNTSDNTNTNPSLSNVPMSEQVSEQELQAQLANAKDKVSELKDSIESYISHITRTKEEINALNSKLNKKAERAESAVNAIRAFITKHGSSFGIEAVEYVNTNNPTKNAFFETLNKLYKVRPYDDEKISQSNSPKKTSQKIEKPLQTLSEKLTTVNARISKFQDILNTKSAKLESLNLKAENINYSLDAYKKAKASLKKLIKSRSLNHEQKQDLDKAYIALTASYLNSSEY